MLNVGSHGDGRRRDDAQFVAVRDREKLMASTSTSARPELAHAQRLFPSRRRASGCAAEIAHDIEATGSIAPAGLFDDAISLVADNRIFKQRNVDIGVVSLEERWAWGFSGVMVRGSGAWDMRKSSLTMCYAEMDFDIPIGKNYDCYDRYHGPHGGDAPVGAHHEAVPASKCPKARRLARSTRSCRRSAAR
jgi:NADH:ubiquinone oxidoreductase subunit D